MTTPLLPKVKDPEHYNQLFSQDSLWEPAVHHLIRSRDLQGSPVRGIRGSHIVYRVGSVWIKLMAPIFEKDMAFEIAGLECIQDKLEVPTPKILFQGELEGWRYIIVSHVEGERIGDVFDDIKLEDQLSLADQIASITKSIHRIEANKVISDRGDWNSFIQARLAGFLECHQSKNLHSNWLSEMPDFINQFDETEFMTDSPVFIHADLTWDHFLVQKVHGGWKLAGVIDFADCRIGHPEYEMITTVVFLFKKNPVLLKKYFEVMGIPKKEMNDRLSEKLLAWTILHTFSNLNNYFSKEMSQMVKPNYSALAKLVFPLN